MTSAQKVIKNLALAFAIFLIITIVSTILGILYGLTTILGLKSSNKELPKEMVITNLENNDLLTLEIELSYTDLIIKTGDTLKIETSNKNITYKQENKKLEIEDKKYNWFSNNEIDELILYLPETEQFEKVEITVGAGKLNIENLTTKKLSFELGTGEVEISNLNVETQCEIDGGAGKLTIMSGLINNLDLDMGVGETNLKALLTGKNGINAGVGNLNIDLNGEKENYQIKADKGLGSIKIDGKEVLDGEKFGNGETFIEVDGGIGNIDIDFTQETLEI